MRRAFITVVAVAGSIILLLFIAAAIAVWTLDVNTLAAPIRERVRASTGRDLRIDGGVSLKLSLEPRIEMRDVTLSNAPWGSGPHLVTAKRLDAQLALLPLITRKFDIRSISLTEPVISLETDATGRGNWELSAATPEKTSTAASESARSASAIIGVGNVVIDNGTVDYRNGRTGAVTHIAIEHLDLHTRDLNTPVNATFRGAIDGVPVALTGNAGPLSALIDQHWPYPVAVDGQVAGRNTKLDAKLASEGGASRLDDVHLQLGSSAFTGSIGIGADSARPSISLRLQSPRVNVADLTLPAAAAVATVTVEAHVPATKPKVAEPVFSADALPVDALRSASIDADMVMGELILGNGKQWQGVHVHFTSFKGRVDAPLIEAQGFGGRLRGTLNLDLRSEPYQVHLTFAGDDLDLGTLLAHAGAATQVRGGKTEVRADITSHGSSAHDWARHANGSVQASSGPASITRHASTGASFAELLGTVLPIANAGNSAEIRCVVVRLPLHEGVAHVDRSIGVETEKVGVIASGTIDFGNETVDLSMRPSVAGGGKFDFSQLALIHWRGPWHTASITVDAASSVGAAAGVTALLAGGMVISPVVGVLVPKIASQFAPQAGACTVARGAHR